MTPTIITMLQEALHHRAPWPGGAPEITAATIFEDINLDTVELWTLTMAIELHWMIDVPDADAEAWEGVADVVRYVEGRAVA